VVEKRDPADWMQLPSDDRILETLGSSDLILTPAIIAKNIDVSREHVARRMSELEKHGLIEREERGHYQITESGEHYLTGDADFSDGSEN